MHHNEDVFPDSRNFNPLRWTQAVDDKEQKPLSRYMVSFSKGTRQCLGMHLAYAELYIGLSNMVRRCNLELFETDRDAVVAAMECFVPRAKEGTKGVRVTVK
jgi:cytochrome P450